ncbi:thioredoxin-like protein [Marasmius fiardii PR-910]|nr:thioredoxin-like protein [Marasmius fiardii PR-910]
MAIKLYGMIISTRATRVMIVLHELGLDYEFIKVDLFKGEHKKPEYLAKHPFGQLPVLDDDGLIIYESRAICRYLATKYRGRGTTLIPLSSDLPALAKFETACSIEKSNFDVYVAKSVAEIVFKPYYNEKPDQNYVNKLMVTLEKNLQVYEQILGKQKYLAGDEISLADLFHISFGAMLPRAGIDIMETSGPNVTRWWRDITSRPSWQRCVDEGALNV